MSSYYEKKEIRKRILKLREELDVNNKEIADNLIKSTLLGTSYYKSAKKIFIYVSYKNEVDTKEIIKKAISDGKEIYIPRTEIETKHMEAIKITSLDNLLENKYGILEPRLEEKFIDPNELDLIIVPGVGFDKYGGRIGYGAGYYDRYFKRIRNRNMKKIALAYDFQIIDKVPMDEYDEKMDGLITEKEQIQIKVQ